MNADLQRTNLKILVFALFAAMLIWSMAAAWADASLGGGNVAPAVATDASADATINVGPDKSITGSVKTSNIVGTAVHIHRGSANENGPAIVTLTRTGDDLWTIPAGAVLDDAQFADYNAGNLYIDVHSAKYPHGEIRAQLAP